MASFPYIVNVAASHFNFEGLQLAVVGGQIVDDNDDLIRRLDAAGLVTILPGTGQLTTDSSLGGAEELVLIGGGKFTLAALLTWLKTQLVVPILLHRPAAPNTAVGAAAGISSARMPFAGTWTGFMASVATASSSGALAIDVNKAGGSVLGAQKIPIAQGALTSVGGTAFTVDTPVFAVDDLITVDVDSAGTNAAGLNVWGLARQA